jgi:hypothetical protein
MNLNLKNLSKAGFKAASIMATQTSLGLFYRVKPLKCGFVKVEYASSLFPSTLGVFDLTWGESRSFRAGHLSLLPPGHCNPIGGKTVFGRVIHEGPVNSLRHLECIFAFGDVLPHLHHE